MISYASLQGISPVFFFFFLIGKRIAFFDGDLIFFTIGCHVLKGKMVLRKNLHMVP